jgi:hypothetical protein
MPPAWPARRVQLAAGVTSLNGIAEALNARGVVTPTGGSRWHATQGAAGAGADAVLRAAMHPFKKKSQMTAAEFKTALHKAGFGVDHGRIVDVSGSCPGFVAVPIFRNGMVNRNATLSKVLWEREAEIKRRPARPNRREYVGGVAIWRYAVGAQSVEANHAKPFHPGGSPFR